MANSFQSLHKNSISGSLSSSKSDCELMPQGVEAESVPAACNRAFQTFRLGHCCAMRVAGHWQWLATEEFQAEIRRLALALSRLGVGHGTKVGIVGDPAPHWLISDLAIMSLGAVTVPLFPTMAADHFRHAVTSTGTKTLIVLGEAGWLAAETHLSCFRVVVVRDVRTARSAQVHGWHDMMRLGDAVADEDPGLYARLVARVRGHDLATIIHTSGSTGLPKGVELTHANLLSQFHSSCKIFPLVAGRDRALSCLPFAHVFERMVVYTYLMQGAPLYIANDVKQVGSLLREVHPAVMTAVPRLIEKIHARIRIQIAESVAIRRQLGKWALALATSKAPTMREKRGSHPWALRVADRLIYSKLRQALGGQLKYLIVGGAALSDELTRFLIGVDLPVYTGYGMTEASPVIAVNRPGARRMGSVGQAFPGIEIRLGAQSEILARGPGIMRGYHRHDQSPVDAEGWLHTGDVGMLDQDGYLTITGRLKELYKTANGKYVAPSPIEQALTSSGHGSSLVDQALIVAEGKPCVGALLFPDPEAVRRRKRELGAERQSDTEFFTRSEVVHDINKMIADVNAHLNHWEQVRCWRVVGEVPSVANEGLTPTMKLRRQALTRRYAKLIDDMYATRPASTGEGGDHG